MSHINDEIPEVVLAFREALEDLQRNDQYEIENLTMIAKEATEHAQAISQEVEMHIRKTRPEYKLPGLYLLDSLVKHIGTPYTVYLGRNLYRTFFDAFTVVDNNTRRAMDELFRSWTRPVPESRDPRPVFPPDITQPIDAALAKMRGIDQRPGSRMQSMPPRPSHTPQSGRILTPNGQYGYAPPSAHMTPQGTLTAQTLPYQSHQPPHTSIHPPHMPPALAPGQFPADSAPSALHRVHAEAISPVNYVYNGPPSSTMSHSARLEKLRYDVQGLLESVRGYLANHPLDQDRLKLLQNLQSLTTLLNGGSLSLTHIQSTEIVVANIARDLPQSGPPAVRSPAPMTQTTSLPVFDPSAIASILAKGGSQSVPLQQVPHHHRHSPIPTDVPASATSQSQAYSAAAASSSTLPMVSIMSLLATPTPQSVAPNGSAPASGLLEQLRASGLLGGTHSHGNPVQPPVASSIISQLVQPQAEIRALNDVKLDAASLKTPRMHLIRQLYEDKPDQCRQCGMRFSPTEQGKKAKGVHIDWHFKVNTRVQDSSKFAVNRSWYIDEHDWISYREELGGYSGVVIEGAMPVTKGPREKDRREQFVFVPTDARLVNLPCPICQEKFEQGWDTETQQPTWKDAVRVGSKYYHASCYSEVNRGAAHASNVVMEHAASSSARSTPDPVLGKRRFDDFRFDASAI